MSEYVAERLSNGDAINCDVGCWTILRSGLHCADCIDYCLAL